MIHATVAAVVSGLNFSQSQKGRHQSGLAAPAPPNHTNSVENPNIQELVLKYDKMNIPLLKYDRINIPPHITKAISRTRENNMPRLRKFLHCASYSIVCLTKIGLIYRSPGDATNEKWSSAFGASGRYLKDTSRNSIFPSVGQTAVMAAAEAAAATPSTT